MRRLADIVSVQPRCNILAKTCVELVGIADALQDVDVVHTPKSYDGYDFKRSSPPSLKLRRAAFASLGLGWLASRSRAAA
jgi:hypothetical protein